MEFGESPASIKHLTKAPALLGFLLKRLHSHLKQDTRKMKLVPQKEEKRSEKHKRTLKCCSFKTESDLETAKLIICFINRHPDVGLVRCW